MRWAHQVCSQCGGELYADYAEVVLVCLGCGHKERPPVSPGKRRETAASNAGAAVRRGASRCAAPTRAVGLVEVHPESRRLIEDVCAAHGYRVVTVAGGCDPIDHDQSGGANLLVVEADRAGLAVRLAKELRGRFPAAPVAVVLAYWCDAEEEARGAAEFVLHAPLRRGPVARMLQVMEDYGGWLPAPLLASKYRAIPAG